MATQDFVEELSQRLAALFPAAENLRDELRTKIEQTLKKAFTDMDLLTREEFAAQADALQRTQQRLQELEKQVATLEQSMLALETLEKGTQPPGSGSEPTQ